MTDHQDRIRKFMVLAGQRCPTIPTMPDEETRRLRAKLILEECLETIHALGLSVITINPQQQGVIMSNVHIIPFSAPDMVEVIDGLADISVVTYGTAIAMGVDMDPIIKEVDQNNLAKFGPGGYRRDDGKWIKPPGHKKPDISGLLNLQYGTTGTLITERPMTTQSKWPDYAIDAIKNTPQDHQGQDTECLLAQAAIEELKKPWWLRSASFMICCHCKKCDPLGRNGR